MVNRKNPTGKSLSLDLKNRIPLYSHYPGCFTAFSIPDFHKFHPNPISIVSKNYME